ncbi:transketolase domain-containing protein [Candidatus Thiomargarita nelsonii]|uniref:Transketolase domain-containing protein n=1 Tax=Candidatus Thiomargarita nelsonii TaxID=1003181 RepID=A0A176S6N5_9GAMM|nr:transketolase domain-containing protein [Candidatus Thiomargarita nelsonii]
MAIIIDMNGQQCDGVMESVLSLGSAADKLTAFGAHVISVDGHDIEAIHQAGATKPTSGALVILAKTNPCQGMDYLETRRPKWHYVRFNSAEEAKALDEAIRKQLFL